MNWLGVLPCSPDLRHRRSWMGPASYEAGPKCARSGSARRGSALPRSAQFSQAGVNVAPMRSDSRGGKPEDVADVIGGEAVVIQGQDLGLPRRQVADQSVKQVICEDARRVVEVLAKNRAAALDIPAGQLTVDLLGCSLGKPLSHLNEVTRGVVEASDVIPVPECDQEGVLHDVVSVGEPAHSGAEEARD